MFWLAWLPEFRCWFWFCWPAGLARERRVARGCGLAVRVACLVAALAVWAAAALAGATALAGAGA